MNYDDESSTIRKQREEIILMTNELKNQEIQLNAYDEANIKLKNSLKSYEEKFKNQEKIMKELEKKVSDLKNQLEDKNTEIESNRTKWNQKEVFYNKQLVKLQQQQFTIDNLNKDIAQYAQSQNEFKDENSKLQLKISEQSNRYRELKQKYDELVKTLTSKNELLETAKEKIEKLEENLRNFVKLYKIKKQLTENILKDKIPHSARDSTIIESEFSIQKYIRNEHDHIYYINLANSILISTQDGPLNFLLQSLKNHWFESNLICEEIKTLVGSKYIEAVEKFNNIFDKYDDRHEDRKLTSTPDHY